MEITEKTKIPLFAVIGVVPFFVGFIIWLSTIAGDSSRASADVKGLKDLVLDVRERLIRIETQINKEK